MRKVTRIALIFLVAILSRAPAADWPDGYVVHENSTSPDGRYGIAVPESDDVEKKQPDPKVEEYYALNYLADLKNHTVLGPIKGSDYFQHQNHAGLSVTWAPDSKMCVAQYDARYGWESVYVLKIKGDRFGQIDIGKHIDAAQKKLFDGYLNGYYRFTPDGKLKVRATSYTNPKQFENEPTYNGLFQGTFDLSSGKWTSSSVRKVKSDDWDNFETAYNDNFAKHMIVAADDKQVPENFTGSVFHSEEEKFDALDTNLNAVYQTVRLVVSPQRFAKLKEEEKAWVTKRDAEKSVEAKSKMTEERIKTLQDLLW
jgi:uncharacterized protein YecT (DUF1311 family)